MTESNFCHQDVKKASQPCEVCVETLFDEATDKRVSHEQNPNIPPQYMHSFFMLFGGNGGFRGHPSYVT